MAGRASSASLSLASLSASALKGESPFMSVNTSLVLLRIALNVVLSVLSSALAFLVFGAIRLRRWRDEG